MASIQSKTLKALMPNREWVSHGQISSESDLENVIQFVTGADSEGTAITQNWTTDNSEYSPFTYAEYTAKYTELENAQPLEELRVERNRRLLETDWWASSDLTMTSEQTAYRQALRDITNTYSDLDTVVWPTKP